MPQNRSTTAAAASRKATDKRSSHVKYTVEAEAMPAKTMRALVRGKIEELLPAYALEITRLAEEEERAGLKALAEVLGVREAMAGDQAGRA